MSPDDDTIPTRLDGTRSTASTSATCRHCRHLHLPARRTCAAFPDGIPEELWWATRGHREPFPGDHGIQYAERPFVERPAGYYDVPDFLRKKTAETDDEQIYPPSSSEH